MHTYQGQKTRFHYNSDFSGKMRIVDRESGAEIEVLAEDVAEFVTEEFVKRWLIGLLEDANLVDILSRK